MKKNTSKFKKNLPNIIVILIFVIGLSVLLYPKVSDYINSLSQSRLVARYFDDVTEMDTEEIQALLNAAREYNEKLLRKSNRYSFTQEEDEEYINMLNTGRDIMGVLNIDKIGVQLPIYHGTAEGVLQVGLGHFKGSSLPVGGKGTHAIITGHTGLPSAKLLTGLDRMREGDTFVIHVLSETLTYQVDQIKVVLPYEVEALGIDPDMDYCTLITCTPYGINTHRLLVRGHRIPNDAGSAWNAVSANAKLLGIFTIIMIFIIPVMPALIIYIIVKCRKISKGGKVYR